MAKEFLENKTSHQDLNDILEFVNSHRENKTTRSSLNSSLCQQKEVFKHFPDGLWGLCSIDYENQRPTHEGLVSYDEQEKASDSWYASDVELSYNVARTNLARQSFELRYSTKREHKPTDFFTKALSNSTLLDLGLGYFSSACFNVLACGFAHFIKNGGNMRLYINPNVTEEDYYLLWGYDDV